MEYPVEVRYLLCDICWGITNRFVARSSVTAIYGDSENVIGVLALLSALFVICTNWTEPMDRSRRFPLARPEPTGEKLTLGGGGIFDQYHLVTIGFWMR